MIAPGKKNSRLLALQDIIDNLMLDHDYLLIVVQNPAEVMQQ